MSLSRSNSNKYAVGDLVRIRSQSKSKGSGTVGVVIKINLHQTSLDTGYRAIHKYIELLIRGNNVTHPQESSVVEVNFVDNKNCKHEESQEIPDSIAKILREQKKEMKQIRLLMENMSIQFKLQQNLIHEMLRNRSSSIERNK